MSSYTFKIGFPTVMKMQIDSCFELEEPVTLKQLQEKVFAEFWKLSPLFTSVIEHGKAYQVTLVDNNPESLNPDQEIKDDITLQKCLHRCREVWEKTTALCKADKPRVYLNARFNKEAHQ